MRKVRNIHHLTAVVVNLCCEIDIPLQLSYYDSKLSLLLSVSQSRNGAIHIMNAGLFQAIRASGLFSADPDLGIGMFVEIDYCY